MRMNSRLSWPLCYQPWMDAHARAAHAKPEGDWVSARLAQGEALHDLRHDGGAATLKRPA